MKFYNGIKKKGFFSLISCILFFLFFEAILSASGWLYLHHRAIKGEKKTLDEKGKEVFSILCMGDSFTFGSGAEPEYSYPKQLEKLLNIESLNKKFIVYNQGGGIPGANSSWVFKNLEMKIQEFKPKIIIILVGLHNRWNLYGSNFLLFTDEDGLKDNFYRLDAFFTRFRTYKLLKVCIGKMRRAIFEREIYSWVSHKAKADNGNLMANLSKETIVDEELKSRLALAEWYLSRDGNIPLAIAELKKIAELYPVCDEAHAKLGRIYENNNDYDLAVAEFKKVVEINPNNLFARNRLWNVYFKMGKNKLAMEEIKRIVEIEPQNENIQQLLRAGLPSLGTFGKRMIQEKMLRYDLTGIIKLARTYGIKTILLSYPITNFRDDIRREVSKRYGATFIDIFSAFQRLESAKNYIKEDYFAKDNHCNANGYGIIAKEIYKVLCMTEFLNKPL